MGIVDYIFLAGSTAWWTTALVYKTGPFDIFIKFKEWAKRVWKKNPLECGTFCSGPWVLIALVVIHQLLPLFNTFFGLLGIAAALRGLSQEYQ